MPDIWMDVDTAVTVPCNLVPLVDATDGKTLEVAIAYDEAGMNVAWNFVTTAGAMTTTAVTPTTGGDYDWTESGTDEGMYKIEIPASGGASANNDTEGFGWISGTTTSCLPFRGPTIGFRAAAINNSLVDGATVDVNVTAMAANVITAAAINADAITAAKIADDAIVAANLATGAITADAFAADAIVAATLATGAITADAFAADAIVAATLATDSITSDAIAASAVTEIQSGLATPTNITAGTITTVTNLTNAPTNGDLTATMKASVNTECDTALTDYDPPTDTEMVAAFTEIKGATWAAGTDTLEHIRNKQTDIETDTAEIGVAGAGLTEAGGTGDHLTAINLPNQTMDITGTISNVTLVDTCTTNTDLVTAAVIKTAIEAAGSHLTLIKAVTDALTTAAATKLALSSGTIVAGTVSHDNTVATTTVFYCDDITEATADHYNGRIVIFTSGALQYQATDITDYELSAGEGKFTVTALTEAPADNVTFIIV